MVEGNGVNGKTSFRVAQKLKAMKAAIKKLRKEEEQREHKSQLLL